MPPSRTKLVALATSFVHVAEQHGDRLDDSRVGDLGGEPLLCTGLASPTSRCRVWVLEAAMAIPFVTVTMTSTRGQRPGGICRLGRLGLLG